MPNRASVFLLALALVAAPARAAERDHAELERIVLEELRESKTPGAAIAIVEGDRVVYANGFGVASVETGAPVTTDMLFRLGSSTKMFNGLALAMLAESGAVRLDEPVSRVVKGLDPAVGRVTPGQLLSHTAGFRDFAAPASSNDEAAFAPAIKGFRADVFFTEPGTIYSYSSPGYWLAGVAIEEAAGKPYADAMNDLVFAPLGMRRTTFRPLVAMTYPVAVGHVAAEAGPEAVRPAANNTVMWPGGSIYSSADELARFAVAMLNGGALDGRQVLPAAAVAKVGGAHAVMPGSGGDAHYGYGLIGYETRGVRLLQHGGFSRGYGSMITFAPERRVAIVVVTNRSGSTLPRSVAKAMELYLPLEPEREEPAAALPPLDAARLAAYAGVYEHAPQRWEVVARDGRLFLREEGKETELRRTGEHSFEVGSPATGAVVFVPSPNGRFDHIFLGLYSARRVPAS